MEKNKVIIKTGLALFAMFFGASNLIFPLYIGANSQNLLSSIAGFIIGGVGIPLIGLIAAGMFNGDYWSFFSRIGKIPAFLTIAFLMLIIGPFGAMARVETVVFSTLESYLPSFFSYPPLFSFLFCSLVFLLAYKKYKIVDILGLFISPIKIFTSIILILAGIFPWNNISALESISHNTILFKDSLSLGYSTMDLLATFFFSSIAFHAILDNKNLKTSSKSELTEIIVKSSILAGIIISIVYIGFMLATYNNSPSLQNIPIENMVRHVSYHIFGNLGSIFVSITISFACISTVLALADVCSDYLYKIIFLEKISRNICLFLVMLATYLTSNLGFKIIMSYTIPILEIIYPAIITLSIMNMLYKYYNVQTVKIPVFSVVILFTVKSLFF